MCNCCFIQFECWTQEVSYVTILGASSSHVTPLKVWAQRNFPFHEQMKEWMKSLLASNSAHTSFWAMKLKHPSLLVAWATSLNLTLWRERHMSVGRRRRLGWIDGSTKAFCFLFPVILLLKRLHLSRYSSLTDQTFRSGNRSHIDGVQYLLWLLGIQPPTFWPLPKSRVYNHNNHDRSMTSPRWRRPPILSKVVILTQTAT